MTVIRSTLSFSGGLDTAQSLIRGRFDCEASQACGEAKRSHATRGSSVGCSCVHIEHSLRKCSYAVVPAGIVIVDDVRLQSVRNYLTGIRSLVR